MKRNYKQRYINTITIFFSLVSLLYLLAACEQGNTPNPTPTVGTTATVQKTGQGTPTPVLTKTTPVTSTSPVPSTATNAPSQQR